MRIKEALLDLPDPRGLQGRDHRLWSIILLVILGKLCGERSLAGVQRFGRLLSKTQKAALGFSFHDTPALGTITETMKAVDASALQRILVKVMVGKDSIDHLSIDGKTLRGSRSVEGPATHCVSVFCNALTAMVGQVSSKSKGLEIPDALRLLESIDLNGIIITGDAMFTQTEITQKIVDKGGHYVLPVKDNQPSLQDAVELALNDPCIPKKTLRKTQIATMAD